MRDALHALARALERVDDHDPQWRRIASLDVEDVETVRFVGRLGYSDRRGAPDRDVGKFLTQLIQVAGLSRDISRAKG